MMGDLITQGIVYALAGTFAGMVSGMFGIGGGVIVVPALTYIFSHHNFISANLAMHMAAATSLAIMIFTSQSTVRAHMRQGSVLWGRFSNMLFGIIIGTILGVKLANYVPTKILRVIFGCFLLIVASEMAFNFKATRQQKKTTWWFNSSVTSLIGLKSGLLGVGGGLVVIPYLYWCGLDSRKIATISALCTLTVSIVGTCAFIVTSYQLPNLPTHTTGYVYWPAVFLVSLPSMIFSPIGANISHKLPVQKLKMAFTIVLIIMAIDLIFK